MSGKKKKEKNPPHQNKYFKGRKDEPRGGQGAANLPEKAGGAYHFEPEKTGDADLFAESDLRNSNSSLGQVQDALKQITRTSHDPNKAIATIGELLSESSYRSRPNRYENTLDDAINALFDCVISHIQRKDWEFGKERKLGIVNSAMMQIRNNQATIRAALDRMGHSALSEYRLLVNMVCEKQLNELGLQEIFGTYLAMKESKSSLSRRPWDDNSKFVDETKATKWALSRMFGKGNGMNSGGIINSKQLAAGLAAQMNQRL
jgi:hypothetical protein